MHGTFQNFQGETGHFKMLKGRRDISIIWETGHSVLWGKRHFIIRKRGHSFLWEGFYALEIRPFIFWDPDHLQYTLGSGQLLPWDPGHGKLTSDHAILCTLGSETLILQDSSSGKVLFGKWFSTVLYNNVLGWLLAAYNNNNNESGDTYMFHVKYRPIQYATSLTLMSSPNPVTGTINQFSSFSSTRMYLLVHGAYP